MPLRLPYRFRPPSDHAYLLSFDQLAHQILLEHASAVSWCSGLWLGLLLEDERMLQHQILPCCRPPHLAMSNNSSLNPSCIDRCLFNSW
jgi:hypothetical protein